MSKHAVPLYPIFLDIRGMPVLVVGGGAVAARKTADLLEAGARVTVVSPAFEDSFSEMKDRTAAAGDGASLALKKRKYQSGDLNGRRLVFAATDNVELNQSICNAAHELGALANSAAPPDAGIFTVPATVRRGAFCLAISTGGASAALSAHWRKRLEKIAGPEWGELVELLEKKRLEIKNRVDDPGLRRAILSALGKARWAAKLKTSGVAEVERQMDAAIAKLEAKR